MVHEVEKIGFTAPTVTEEEIFEYSFEGEGLTVLVFFPGAFTSVCTEEMCRFRDSLGRLNDLGAEVIGVSVDTPFSLDEFREQYDLNFKLVSDNNKKIIDNYNVKTDFSEMGFTGLAQRALFIVQDGEVVYIQVLDDPDNMPDLQEPQEELETLENQ